MEKLQDVGSYLWSNPVDARHEAVSARPKGKVNENEDPVKCAIREVYEETGYDCGHLINGNTFVEGQTSNFHFSRLYIVNNVPIDTKFCPRTRNEIKDCSWFVLDQLPTNRNDEGYVKDQRKIRANSFYMILPFISKLKHWIMSERLNQNGHQKKKQHNQNQTQNQNQVFAKQPSSPFFHNNVDHQARNGKQRNKSTSDAIETFTSPATNGTFYNDHLKLQNNSSTPIETNGGTSSPFMPSSSSAFRATNSDNKFKKKNSTPKLNGKTNQSGPVATNGNQDQFKRKLFNEMKENYRPMTIKPFTMDMPESWKNFKFDRQKLFNCL
jgi:mRNA-decapping enzyme subunit 2